MVLKRLEDLGRITEKISRLLDSDAMEVIKEYRDGEEFAESYQTEEDREILFHKLESLKNELYEIWQLARWGDEDE